MPSIYPSIPGSRAVYSQKKDLVGEAPELAVEFRREGCLPDSISCNQYRRAEPCVVPPMAPTPPPGIPRDTIKSKARSDKSAAFRRCGSRNEASFIALRQISVIRGASPYQIFGINSFYSRYSYYDSLGHVPMNDEEKLTRFEGEMLPLMNDAYNLARWLVQNEPDARDMVQEAYLRAFKFFSGVRGETGRAWLLRIVRNVCYDHLKKRKVYSSDEELENIPDNNSPESNLQVKSDVAAVRSALAGLPEDFRTVLVLREMEELSYREISEITQVPIGTVMSRLARGRQQLAESLKKMREKDLV